MKTYPPINIIPPESVNELRDEVDRIAQDPEAMLHLVDLIFGFEKDKFPPS